MAFLYLSPKETRKSRALSTLKLKKVSLGDLQSLLPATLLVSTMRDYKRVKRGDILLQEIPEEYINSEIVSAAINNRKNYDFSGIIFTYKKNILDNIPHGLYRVIVENSRSIYDAYQLMIY